MEYTHTNKPKIGEKVNFYRNGEAGEIIYSAVLTKNEIGSTGVAVVNPTIVRKGMITEYHPRFFFRKEYWMILDLDNNKLVKLNLSKS